MPRDCLMRGGGYVREIVSLLKQNVVVEEKNITISGIRCKQLTVGDKYKTISRTQTMTSCSFWVKDNKNWAKLPVPWMINQFIVNLIRFRKYIFYENNEQGDTTNMSKV